MFIRIALLFISFFCGLTFYLTLGSINSEDENNFGVSGLEPPLHEDCDHTHDHHTHDYQSSTHDHHHKSSYPVTAVLMTLASGSTAVVGGLLVVYFGVMSDKILGHMLSFAAGVMLYISYGDILMHSIEDLDVALSSNVHSHQQQHNHHHHNDNDEEGHGHTHGPGLFFANAFLFLGMVLYICISLAIKTLSGTENTTGHGHSHFGNGNGRGNEHLLQSHSNEGNESLMNSKMDTKMETKSSTVSRPRQRRKLPQPQPLSNDDDDSTQAKDSSKDSSEDKVVMSAMRQGLMWTGLNAALGIAAHNLPEGLVVYNHTILGICEQTSNTKNLSWWEFPNDISKCLTRGVAMTFAIALHNIPEGMAVAAPIFAATESKWEAMKWCILSSLGEPIAAVLFGLIFSTGLTKFAMAAVNATTAGIMIALCLAELMPTAASLAGAQAAVISNVVGQLLMFVSIHFMRKSGVH